MPFGPFIASLALGFIKGLTSSSPSPFNAQQDFLGPVKEELIYRGAPLWFRPSLPFGSTAAVFAVDHVVSDYRQHAMTPTEVVARLGDTFLGGCLYETAFRQFGILGAIGAHCGHNWAVGLGSRVRR